MAAPDYWLRAGELPGILNWALKGLQDYAAEGELFVPQRSRQRTEELSREADRPLEWVERHLEYLPPGQKEVKPVYHRPLYTLFRQDMENQKVWPPPSTNKLTTTIREVFPKAEKKSARVGSGYDDKWEGLRMKVTALDQRPLDPADQEDREQARQELGLS
jgi:phage/plasmid-associated DNA primase